MWKIKCQAVFIKHRSFSIGEGGWGQYRTVVKRIGQRCRWLPGKPPKPKMEEQMPKCLLQHCFFSYGEGVGGWGHCRTWSRWLPGKSFKPKVEYHVPVCFIQHLSFSCGEDVGEWGRCPANYKSKKWRIKCPNIYYSTSPSPLDKELEDEVVAGPWSRWLPGKSFKPNVEFQMPEYLLQHLSFSFGEGVGGWGRCPANHQSKNWKLKCPNIYYSTSPSLSEKELKDEDRCRTWSRLLPGKSFKVEVEDQMIKSLIKHRSFSLGEGVGGWGRLSLNPLINCFLDIWPHIHTQQFRLVVGGYTVW